MRKNIKQQGRIVVLSGPSGAGKTTLHDLLLKSNAVKGSLARSISTTTRLPRGNEKSGREYFFVSTRMFEYKIRAGHFLEWAKVFGNYYGTPIKPLRSMIKSGLSVLLCIDVKGGLQVRNKYPRALMIFVMTSDIAELRRRLEQRGTDTNASLEKRLKTATEEIAQAKQYDYVIINDSLDTALGQLTTILSRELGLCQAR